MRIAVCVKQVPDTNEIRINPETGTLIRDGVPSILNNDDANALEQALQLKDADPKTEVVAITMGPPQAKRCCRSVWLWERTKPSCSQTELWEARIPGRPATPWRQDFAKPAPLT